MQQIPSSVCQSVPTISSSTSSFTNNTPTISNNPNLHTSSLESTNGNIATGISSTHGPSENITSSYAIPPPLLPTSSGSSTPLILPSNASLSNIQLPTQPLDISEVSEFSAKNTLSSQPPPNVTSTLENIVTSKQSTVSLLRGMRLKKNSQINGAKLEDKNESLRIGNGNSVKDDEKRLFVRPFEDGYACANKTKLNSEVMSEIKDTRYAIPEYKANENISPRNINVSIPVSLQSNLKNINANYASVLKLDEYDSHETNDIGSGEAKLCHEMTNNNNIVLSSEVCK